MPLHFINPNFHIVLVHYPLAIFVVGVIIELFGFLWRRSVVRTAARWMIPLGALLSIPAATSGIYALFDCKQHQGGFTPSSYQMLRMHAIYMGCASILAVLCAIIGVGASDVWRKRLHFPLLLGCLAAWGLMVLGAWNGGETIHQNGTSVAIIHVTAHTGTDGITTKAAEQVDLKVPDPEDTNIKTYKGIVKYQLGGELQQHIIMSGFAFAVALGALAMAIRRVNSNSLGREIVIERPIASREKRSGTNDMSVIHSFNQNTEVAPEAPTIPSGRFWLLAALALIATTAMGYWVINGDTFFQKAGWDNFVESLKGGLKDNRQLAHVILGGSMLVIALICAILAAAAPRQGLLLGFFGLLLMVAIAGQIWIGVLLTFDKNGPLTRFKNDDDRAKKEAMVQPTAPPEAPLVAAR